MDMGDLTQLVNYSFGIHRTSLGQRHVTGPTATGSKIRNRVFEGIIVTGLWH